MGALNEKYELTQSLYTGFVDFESESLDKYRPKLLINDHKKGKKVLTSLIHELNSCDEFFFSVAFITYSGVLVLLNTLKELEAKNIKGKILASQYLNFTNPNALKKLLSFSNIELRMVTDEDLHAKGYIFRKSEQYNLIVGSSNLTQDALASNKEWNIKVTSTDKGSLILDTLAEFETTFNRATLVDKIWINEYRKIYQRAKHYRNTSSDSEKIASDSNQIYKINPFILPTISPNQMQKEALMGIENVRAKGENKSLLISATGTGKTYLAAFDVAKFCPKRMLFLAHREQILNQSIESFKNVLGHNIHTGLVGGGHRDLEAQYIFSTVQTMSKDSLLETLDPTYFDYIIVDESHRAGAESYQKILNYYQPRFLLGMTATPERTDAYNICKDFDYNIAYEIRLEQALEEKMLCPFHYFGVTELKINGAEIQEDTEFRYLVSDERVNHIIEKIKFYGHQGDYVKGLIFCSRNEEAIELSALFNQRDFRTIALSGSDSQDKRENAIKRLEDIDRDDHLDYIFTVDIFNEGVDIPSINQIVMLRPTQSAIIFVQQLGRGLRHAKNKDFVVILDFIGNYKNNFLIPIALSDDRSFNKDTIRRFVAEGSRVIPGCTTINFDEIAKKKIYEAIDQANFNSVTYIKESYQNLKYRLGRVPSLMDFEDHQSIDLARLFENSSLGSYHTFLSKYEKDYTTHFSDIEVEILEFVSKKLAIGKRPHELIVLDSILNQASNLINNLKDILKKQYGIEFSEKTKTNVINVLTNQFATGVAKNTYQNCIFLQTTEKGIVAHPIFCHLLENIEFRSTLQELIDYGLYRYEKYYGIPYKKTSFQLYQKYSYEDVCRLLEWEKNIVPLNIGGYKYDHVTKTYPIFINYHKEDDISDSIKYEDRFLSTSILKAISKSKRTLESNDVVTACNAEELGVKIELFVRKNKEDNSSKEFYYLGRMKTIGTPQEFIMNGSGLSAVELTYQLESPVREELYEYITKA